jgi:dihydrofolate reductase
MRRIIAFNRVTADGYFSGLDGNLNWVVPDQEIDEAGAARMPDSDTILFGRRTYEMFESFWPNATKNGAMDAVATWMNNADKVVYSKRRKEVTWKNSRLLSEFEPREIDAMKRQAGKTIMVFGSGSIASQLTQYGLIDEYQFVVSPTLLGAGRSMLSEIPTTSKLTLIEAKAYSSGNVMLRYARATP